jgi:hypothetical protein
MKIEYTNRKNSFKPSDLLSAIPFACLNKDIQLFLIERGCYKAYYEIHCNGTYFFIHLDNGDRLDIPFESL